MLKKILIALAIIFCLLVLIVSGRLLYKSVVPQARTVCVIPYQHFDPVWLRDFDKEYEYSDNHIASARQVEGRIISKYLKYCRARGYSFVLDQAFVLRKFLESNPGKLPLFRKLVKKNKFEPVGGMEVTPDTNLPCGESIVRNILYGKLWMEETFDTKVRAGWLMDVFGMSAQLPQILKKSEFEWLPQTGRPGNLGKRDWWEGIDGTRIYCGNFIANSYYRGIWETIYCGSCRGYGCGKCSGTGINSVTASGKGVRSALKIGKDAGAYSQIFIGAEEALPYPGLSCDIAERNIFNRDERWKTGVFDEGLEVLKKENFRLPGSSGSVAASDWNPVFTGCYTTRIELKMLNRRCENALIETEKMAALASVWGYGYPGDELRNIWKELIFTQFHDGITGSHTDPVYYTLIDKYRELLVRIGKVRGGALSFFAGKINTGNGSEGVPLVVFNSLNWTRGGTVSAELQLGSPLNGGLTIADARGSRQLIEKMEILDKKTGRARVEFFADKVPGLGYKTYYARRSAESTDRTGKAISPYVIENEYYRITADRKTFGIKSIYDKAAGREILDTGSFYGNELCVQDDLGSVYCVQSFGKLERLGRTASSGNVQNSGNAQKIISSGSSGEAAWRQEVTLYRKDPLVHFDTEVDWKGVNRRLRIAFPTAIKKDCGYYEIPYGTVRRDKYEFRASSTNSDSTACGDWPAQKWVEVTDGRYSVALINEGIPGHKIEGGVIYLSVLRSPTMKLWGVIDPFSTARDRGRHKFSYCLYAGKGNGGDSGTVRRAYEFNFPLACVTAAAHKGERPAEYAFCTYDDGDAVISSIKRAEKDNLMVLRMYEPCGRHSSGTLGFGAGTKVSAAFESNLLERERTPLDLSGDRVKISFSPFEITTLLAELKDTGRQ
jgi:alpha-mannosidase